uniref:Succinate dehydrogenase [ubiquinone] cytochrome b small subunit n=1 Tax=Aceria tosichella TaxID=561515 RepID=A0A6G1SHB1_9ACAR
MLASRALLRQARKCLLAPPVNISHARALYTSRILTNSHQESPNLHPMHSHDKLWKAERYLSWALLGVLPAAWVIPHPLMDYAVATSLVVHVHWGVEAIVTDYIRPAIFGPFIPKVSIALVYVLSVLAASGLFIFNWTDVGLTQAFKMIARI